MSERVSSLVVAVPAPPDHLAGTIKPLKYPYADADKFQEYVRNAWPNSAPAWHVRLPNGSTAATLTAIRGAVAQLASLGQFDMFFMYLTGHGVLDREGQHMSKVTTSSTTSHPSQLAHNEIAMRAHEKWCKRGRPHGTDKQDWMEAEAELRSEMSRVGGATATQPPNPAWFCTAELAAGDRGLGASELDRFLGSVPARHTFLFLDCCHASQIVQGTSFFTTLEAQSLSRLYMCSSQSGQLTWEDDTYGHGLFSAVLLEALRTGKPGREARGPLSTVTDLDVDGELFPYLCKEVPLIIHRLKNRQQEPVKGGIARWPVRLPVGNNPGNARQQTVLGAVLHRLRRIAVAVALWLVVSVLFIESFLYHLAVDEEGQVVVRRGIRPLAGLLPGHSDLLVQTDLSEQDVDPNSDRLGSLRRGSIVGVWGHQSGMGYREWLDDILPALREPTRSRTKFEITGQLPREVMSDSPPFFQGWRAELTAESLLTNPECSEERAAWLAGSVPKLSAVDPESGVIKTNSLDFTVLKISTEEIVRLQTTTEVWATANPKAVFPVFIELVRIVCYRAAHGLTEKDALDEARGLADVLRSIGAARFVRGQPAMSGADLKSLSEEAERLERYGQGRQLWVLAPMAGLASLIHQREVQAALLRYLDTFNPDQQGPLLNLHQVLALDALGQSAAGRQLDPKERKQNNFPIC